MSTVIAAIDPGTRNHRPLFFATLTIGLAVSLPVIYATLTLIEFASHLWPLAAIPLHVVAVLATVAGSYITLKYPQDRKRSHNAAHQNSSHTNRIPRAVRCALATAGLVGLVVSFSELCRNLALRFGGFTATQMGFWHWLQFGVSVVVDNVTFGALQASGWQASEIQPIEPWSRALAWAYTVALALMGLGIIGHWIKAAGEREFNSDQARRKTYFKFLVPRLLWLVLALVWILPTLVFGGAAVSGALTWQSAVSGVQVGVPIVLGVWLGWQSLLALRGPRLRNRAVVR